MRMATAMKPTAPPMITIIIGSPLDKPQAERDATAAAILASVKLTG